LGQLPIPVAHQKCILRHIQEEAVQNPESAQANAKNPVQRTTFHNGANAKGNIAPSTNQAASKHPDFSANIRKVGAMLSFLLMRKQGTDNRSLLDVRTQA
jgi:hypothetical protein